MSQTSLETPDIKAQYVAQVATDLEHNTQEQQRIAAEMAALKAQLDALEGDHALLVSVQQALGGQGAGAQQAPGGQEAESQQPSDAGSTDTGSANVPAPRRRSGVSKPARRRKAEPSSTRKAEPADAKKPEAKAAEKAAGKAAGKEAKPTLIALVRQHLAGHAEPRSAAEITASLTTSHPDRGIKATVVRTTAESLVAKGLAHRSKQGSSVFYASTQGSSDEPSDKAEPAGA
ncbi:hypothetical protein [Streptomyces sp. NPDC020917]|uniref:hypothetical protein n=1 Tax=Streptomyces sp. NPDC020917 TaxID=3365102 RepID=UPI0037AA302B